MTRTDKVFRATALVTIVIIASKLVGFVRDMIMASYFGTGLANDAYVASNILFYLPILLFSSCITSTLIPLFVRAREQGGPKAASRFGSNAMNIFGLAALAVSVIMYLLAGPLVHIVFPGFDADKIALTARLTRIMMLSLFFNVTSIVMSSLLNAREKYVAAQLTGFPLSFTIIVAAVFFSRKYGIDAIAWGVFAAGVLQVLIQIPYLAGWFHYSPRIDFGDPQFKRLLILAIPAILSMAVSELNHMIDSFFASMIDDRALSALNYGYKLITFVSGVLVVPITTIMFSKLSKLVVKKDRTGVVDTVKKALETVAVIVVPITAISIVMSDDIVRLAYARGAFGEDSVHNTAGAFLFFVIGVLAFGLRDLLSRAFHSMQDTKTSFRVTIIGLALNTLLDWVLGHYMGINGLALATSLVGFMSVTVMFILFRRRMGQFGLKETAVDILKIFAGGCLCVLASFATNWLLPEMYGTLHVFLRLAAVTLVSGLVYLFTLLALGERQIMSLVGGVSNKRRR
jgi:putative peptidoglycan lipid II flippase